MKSEIIFHIVIPALQCRYTLRKCARVLLKFQVIKYLILIIGRKEIAIYIDNLMKFSLFEMRAYE